ncbi:MAG TPA: hypothetical protein VMD77_16320, partial [Candidatus Baltobacteraceae bacterium]|nr:hypothetical protein [Candidatus Baltobacteraceae bacterium]
QRLYLFDVALVPRPDKSRDYAVYNLFNVHVVSSPRPSECQSPPADRAQVPIGGSLRIRSVSSA